MTANIFMGVLKQITSEFEGIDLVLSEDEQICLDSFVMWYKLI